jgi:hypothetical protein
MEAKSISRVDAAALQGAVIGSRSRKRGKRLALTIADFCNKIGTFRTFRHVRKTVAIGGKADVLCSG